MTRDQIHPSAPHPHSSSTVGADEPGDRVPPLTRSLGSQIPDQWIGKRVLCERIGRKAEFIGVVLRRHAGSGPRAYVVRDEKRGSHWHREPSEFALYEEPKPFIPYSEPEIEAELRGFSEGWK